MDRVRLSPDILRALLGVHGGTATCSVIEFRAAFGRGPEGEIDLQLPGGKIVKSLRFEHVAEDDRAERLEELPAHKSKHDGVSWRLDFTEHQRS